VFKHALDPEKKLQIQKQLKLSKTSPNFQSKDEGYGVEVFPDFRKCMSKLNRKVTDYEKNCDKLNSFDMDLTPIGRKELIRNDLDAEAYDKGGHSFKFQNRMLRKVRLKAGSYIKGSIKCGSFQFPMKFFC
jgi:hypothetical protein